MILRNIHLSHTRINKLFSEENKVPRNLFEARKVAGSAKCKQSMTVCTVLSFKVILFIVIIQLWQWRDLVYLVCFGKEISVHEDVSLLIKINSPQLHSYPLHVELVGFVWAVRKHTSRLFSLTIVYSLHRLKSFWSCCEGSVQIKQNKSNHWFPSNALKLKQLACSANVRSWKYREK